MSGDRVPALALFAAVLWSAGCTIERADVRTPSGEPPEADTTEVRRAVERIAGALESGDLAALDTLYDDSVLVHEAGSATRGWARYRDGHLVPELRALSDRRVRFAGIRVRLVDGTAWATFDYRLDARRDGAPVTRRGVGTMIFEERGERWQVVYSHTSSRERTESQGQTERPEPMDR